MEKKQYNKDYVTKLKHDNKKYLIITLSFITIAIIEVIVTAFFINDYSKLAIQLADSFLLSISICVFIFIYLNIIKPNKFYIRHINSILCSKKETLRGRVSEIGDPILISKYIRAQIVKLEEGKKTFSLYAEDGYFDMKIEEHVQFEVIVSNNYIIEIREITNEGLSNQN